MLAIQAESLKAMGSSKSNPMSGKVDVDETYVGGQDDQAVGRSKSKKKLIVVAIEKKAKVYLECMLRKYKLPAIKPRNIYERTYQN